MGRHIEGPWFRSARDAWYATVGGRNLPPGVKGKANRALAVDAWHKVMADATPTTTRATTLADAESRLKRTTVRIYGDYLRHLKSGYCGKPAAG